MSEALTIVITDCDHASVDIERRVADAAGAELVLAQCSTEDEVIAAAATADVILVQYAPITNHVLSALPGLKAIGRYGVGVDTVDVAAATRHGVAVCNVPDYGTEDVSDHAIALAMALSRGLGVLNATVRAGNYQLETAKPLHRVRDMTFGVVGTGRIGAATARKAAGLGFRVIACDSETDRPRPEIGVEECTLEEVLAEADIVSLHVPLTEATHHLIDAEALARMKPDSFLVNTCRGGVVDTEALVAALRAERLGGAGLDVFEAEPLPADHPLLGAGNVIVTPHAAWYSEESYTELKARTLENPLAVAQGRRPRNILNPEVLDLTVASEGSPVR